MRTIEQIESEDAIFSVTKEEVKQWIEKEIANCNIVLDTYETSILSIDGENCYCNQRRQWLQKVLMYLE